MGPTDEGNLGSTNEEGGTGLLEGGEEMLDDASEGASELGEDISDILSGESTTR